MEGFSFEESSNESFEATPESLSSFEERYFSFKPLRNITWEDGSRLEVKPQDRRISVDPRGIYRQDYVINGPVETPTYGVTYVSSTGQQLNLNTIFEAEDKDLPEADRHDLMLIGADTFLALDLDAKKSGPSRQTLIGIDPDQLDPATGGNKHNLFAVFHELGHSYLYRGMDEVVFRAILAELSEGKVGAVAEVRKNPQTEKLAPYARTAMEMMRPTRPSYFTKDIPAQLASGSTFRQILYEKRDWDRQFDVAQRIMHERLAWAFALKAVRGGQAKGINPAELGLGEKGALMKYVNGCLGSYDENHTVIMPKNINEHPFTQGLRKIEKQ